MLATDTVTYAAPIASFAGAIVGASGSVYVAAKKERADRRAEALQRETTLRGAARTVQSDLEWVIERLTRALENGKFWSARYDREPLSREFHQVLAEGLAADDWQRVGRALDAVERVQLRAAKRRTDARLSRGPITEEGRQHSEEDLVLLRDGIAALGPLAGATAPALDVFEDDQLV